jgi:hypothetical protein
MLWRRDRTLWAIVVAGLILRSLLLFFWGDDLCVRDECTYLGLSKRMAEGKGMTTSAGWLWAPGYPVLLSLHRTLTGFSSTIKGLQILCAGVSMVLIYVLAGRTWQGLDPARVGRHRTAARVAAALYSFSPSMIFFSVRLWSEVIYAMLLLLALLVTLWARDRVEATRLHRWLGPALGVGALVGCCMLFRGVATYMVPIFMASLVWGRLRRPRAWAQALAVVAIVVAVVGPYSRHATSTHGQFVLTDRTMGQMMWLGNNDFSPITFDYGNGKLSQRAFKRTARTGRKPCGKRKDGLERDDCQTAAGKAWIEANPEAFVQRMPLRVAQMLNPHSLLTRHLRWNRYPGMPQWLDELIIAWGALCSGLVLLIGSLGLASRGRGGQGLLFGSILVYHCAAIAMLAGLSRYRVPLEPLLMIYAGGWLVAPRLAWAELRQVPWRVALAVVVLAVLTPLVLWFLPAGWPTWRTW